MQCFKSGLFNFPGSYIPLPRLVYTLFDRSGFQHHRKVVPLLELYIYIYINKNKM